MSADDQIRGRRSVALILPAGEIDIASTLGPLTALAGDPTVRLRPGRFDRATLTPDGPGALSVVWEAGATGVRVDAQGDGAGWLLDRAPALLGYDDDVSGFHPDSPQLRELWRRHRGDRIGRTATLWHDLAWFVVQQRIRRADAAAQWRRLVTALGTPAPGRPELMTPPAPAAVARLHPDEFHRFGIERRRAEHLVNAARAARGLQRLVDRDGHPAMPALRSVRGIGPWTASCLITHTWGDPDTVILGDDGIPSLVAWLLAGERRADDARLAELLEPYRPHRYRIIRLAFLGGQRPPRRHSRGARHDIRWH
jgi:3-methyladenine DNA glycosylase/8-oxoguanine DNA glycosylase